MKKFDICSKGMKKALSEIHFVDRCLCVIMIVLLAQSAYSLFHQGNKTADIQNIDVIVRTAAASIFGYFLSANFIHREPDIKYYPTDTPESELVGQDIPDTGNGQEKREEAVSFKLQVVIATSISLFCLVTLLLVRNIPSLNMEISHTSSVSATIVQFRDFVSGCIGFLIGCPTGSKKK